MTAKLNANANTWTPGGTPPMPQQVSKDIENEIATNDVNDLTAAMHDTGVAANPVPTSTALPPHMKKHAAEFWFPESRNCGCCKGYKHGCTCQASNSGTCASCAN